MAIGTKEKRENKITSKRIQVEFGTQIEDKQLTFEEKYPEQVKIMKQRFNWNPYSCTAVDLVEETGLKTKYLYSKVLNWLNEQR